MRGELDPWDVLKNLFKMQGEYFTGKGGFLKIMMQCDNILGSFSQKTELLEELLENKHAEPV